MKKTNTPRRKRICRKKRIESAGKWILNYSGENIVKGYANWYGVNFLCSIKELKMNGVIINDDYEKQVIQSIEKKRSMKQMNKKHIGGQKGYPDENFTFLAGFTSGGAPYGITHEESLEYESEIISNDINLKH